MVMDMAQARLWTKDFTLNCLVCFGINLSYYLTMVVITDYAAKILNASLSEAGFACGVIILGALFARLVVGRHVEAIGTKRCLYCGILIFFISTLANIATENLYIIYLVRFVQGIGFGVASTATGTIMAQIVPDERRGEGTSYFAMFVTLSTAIGPFLGIYIYQNGNLRNNLMLSAFLLVLCGVATYVLVAPIRHSTSIRHQNIGSSIFTKFFEKNAAPIAVVTFFVSIGFSSILGFISSYTMESGLHEGGKFFFIIYAAFAVFSRPLTGRLFDQKGDNIVMLPSFLFFSAGLFTLAISQHNWNVLVSGALIGLGFGTYMSCAQAIAIKVSPKNHMGLATSTFFIFMDLGIGFGPLLLGKAIPVIHFQGMYQMLSIAMIACMALYYAVHGRMATALSARQKQDGD